ncbi:MAG: hypothetical protein Q9174_006389 [Haloplaca sp. 1 TL-2023]
MRKKPAGVVKAGAVKKKTAASMKKVSQKNQTKGPSKKATAGEAAANTNADEPTSPFLKLSVEIRNMIYGYVLGHRLVHITQVDIPNEPIDPEKGEPEEDDPKHPHTYPYKIGHIVCTQRFTEDDAYHEGIVGCPKVPLTDDPDLHVAGYGPRHEWCWLSNFVEEVGTELFRKMSTGGSLKLDLSLLFVNRQIHGEAFNVLWTSNRFCFRSATMFGSFTGMLSSRQKQTMAKMMIVKDELGYPRVTWNSRCLERQWKSLKGLRSVHLYLEMDQCDSQATTTEYPGYFIGQFMVLQQLELTDVRVIVGDAGWDIDPEDDGDSWHPEADYDTRHDYPPTLLSDPKCPLSHMNRDSSERQRFSWIEKRELACHFELLLLGQLKGADFDTGVKRKLEKEKVMRDEAMIKPKRDGNAYYLYHMRIAGT